MEKKFKRTTVTSALPYANGPVHIGHLAGVYVPADIYVRYLRLKKEDVLFIGGSDEHGVPITIRAKKEGITPQDVVDRYHSLIKKSFEEFGISFDVYSRKNIPCRPLYHRRMSPLSFGRRLRRPMRKMRNLTFSYGSYQPEKRHQRQQTGNERNQTLVSSSRQARRMAAQMDSGRSQRMASQRIRPVQKLARHGPATTCREP